MPVYTGRRQMPMHIADGRALFPPTEHIFEQSVQKKIAEYHDVGKSEVGNVSIVPRIMQFVNIGYALLISPCCDRVKTIFQPHLHPRPAIFSPPYPPDSEL